MKSDINEVSFMIRKLVNGWKDHLYEQKNLIKPEQVTLIVVGAISRFAALNVSAFIEASRSQVKDPKIIFEEAFIKQFCVDLDTYLEGCGEHV